MSDEPTFTSGSEWTLAALADLFTRSFAGYVMPVHVTAAALAARCRVEHVDLDASRVVVVAGAPVGLALITRRGDRARLGVMGFVEAYRGQKLGARTLSRVLDESRARGEQSMLLECFTTNEAGVALYRKAGFSIMRLLVGWERPAFPTGQGDASLLEEREPDAFGRALAALPELDLPWQLAAPTLIAVTAPTRTFSLEGHAFACFTESESALSFRGLLTLPAHRRRGLARRLLEAVSARFPGRALHFPPIFPEDAGQEAFASLGFSKMPLAQHEMIWTP